MNRLITLVIVVGISSTSYGQDLPNDSNSTPVRLSPDERQLAEKLTSEKMTQGLTSGLNFLGGVAGYAGPPRASDIPSQQIGTSIPPGKANADDQPQEIRNSVRQKTADRQKAFVEQQDIQAQEKAQVHEAERQAAIRRAQEAEAIRRARETEALRQNNANALIQACRAKGLRVDFVTGNCLTSRGRQINPQNLYSPFTAPLAQSNPSELITRCGALGRAADFVTGRCM
jgi:hypothetical protein